MRKVANSFSEHAEEGEAGLNPALCVVRMEVTTDRDAPHRYVAIAELRETTLRIHSAQERG